MIYQRNPDGSWKPAEPLPLIGWKARLSEWCHRHGLKRTSRALVWLDERGLGR